MLTRLLNINELDKSNWINYQDRMSLRKRVNKQVISVELYINKPLDMTIEVCALKKVLIEDLILIFEKSYKANGHQENDNYTLTINEYKEYLEICGINYVYEKWLNSAAAHWESGK